LLQILDNGGSLGNSLSSQELFQLLHTPQQQPLVDSYGVPLMQQPQLQQHFHQQAALFPPATFLKQEEPVQDNLVVFKTEFNPDYQTFNYEEQYQGPSHQRDKYRNAYDEQEESENAPSVTVVRKSPESTITSFQEEFENQNTYKSKSNSVTEEDTYYDNTATNPENENQEDYEENNNNASQNEDGSSTSYIANGPLGTSYYTTLPNREAAETLATLAAAGNINSNLVNHIRKGEEENSAPVRGDIPAEEDYAEEEEEEESEEPQINKPLNTFQRPKDTEIQETIRLSSEHKQRHPVIHPHKPQEEVQEEPEYMDYGADLDQQGYKHDQGATGDTDLENKQQHKEDATPTNTNLQFGARIRPKRNK
jgi:hypothetical protein